MPLMPAKRARQRRVLEQKGSVSRVGTLVVVFEEVSIGGLRSDERGEVAGER